MISTKTILVTTSALDPKRGEFEVKLIRELGRIPSEEWSTRENRLMEDALDHGELYHMTIEQHDSFVRYITDLGDPDSKITVDLPKGIDENKAINAVQLLAEGLFQ